MVPGKLLGDYRGLGLGPVSVFNGETAATVIRDGCLGVGTCEQALRAEGVGGWMDALVFVSSSLRLTVG